MTDTKGERAKAKASREQRAAAAAARRQRQEDEWRQRRSAQLQAAEDALSQIEEPLRAVQTRLERRKALDDHLQAFYTEVGRFARARGIPATPLVIEQANDIVRDAKEIVSGDTYLDRVKPFVPAGDHDFEYSDVLMVAATVRAALRRATPVLETEAKRLRILSRRARTIAAAVRLMLSTGESELLKSDVEDALGEKPMNSWFFEAEDQGFYFDIERLDSSDLKTVFTGGDEE